MYVQLTSGIIESYRLKWYKQGLFQSLTLPQYELLLLRFHKVPSGSPGSIPATKNKKKTLPVYSVKGMWDGVRGEWCAFAFVYRGQMSISVSSSVPLSPTFWKRVSCWTWSLAFCLGCLAGEDVGAFCLHSLELGLQKYAMRPTSYMNVGLWNQVLGLVHQAPYPLSHLSSSSSFLFLHVLCFKWTNYDSRGKPQAN